MKAMIFAAGRGERMRPLTDTRPKPLLTVAGTPLIVRQIEALAAAGIREIAINHAWLGAQIETELGNGTHWGVRLHYSAEGEALETAGGIAKALPLLQGEGNVFLAVSGDIVSDFDYVTLTERAAQMRTAVDAGMHLVMVPNPPFHPDGDFVLAPTGALAHNEPGERLTFGNIGLYDLRLFAGIEPGTRMAMSPIYRDCIAAGCATGERFDGLWENVGTPAQLEALDRRLRTIGAQAR